MRYEHLCKCCNKIFTTNYQEGSFCCRACSATYTSRFHNMGYFIHNESMWLNNDYSSIIKSAYEPPSKISTSNDYFSGYYMDIHHEVRSGSEHNLCRILQLCQIDYDYELFTFKLTDNKTYRPDIYIPSENTFYEMKGEWRGDSYEKVQLFQNLYPSIKLIIIDMKTYNEIEKYAKYLYPYINFNQHIKVTKQLVRHIPQFRTNNINYDPQELNYWYFTNKVNINQLKNPIIVSDDINKVLKTYRLNGKIYYAINDNKYFYNEEDITILKNKLKEKITIMIPSIIQKEISKK